MAAKCASGRAEPLPLTLLNMTLDFASGADHMGLGASTLPQRRLAHRALASPWAR